MRLPVAFVYLYVLIAATALVAAARLYPYLNPVSDPALPRLSTTTAHLSTTAQRSRVLGYQRERFGNGWATDGACTTREHVLRSQFTPEPSSCEANGEAIDPYTGIPIAPNEVDIDHIFPLAAAWDLGAYRWDDATRRAFANDPLNLVATRSEVNRDKSDQLPSEWLPPSPRARCWYARRLAVVAVRYDLALPETDVTTMKRHCWVGELLRIQ